MLRLSVVLVVFLSVVGLATPIHKARPRVAPPSPVRAFSETEGVVGLTEANDAARPSPPPVDPAPGADMTRVAKRAQLERRFDPFSLDVDEELESNEGPVSTQELHLGDTRGDDTSAEDDFEALFTPRDPPSAASQYDVFPIHDPQPRSPEPEFSYSKFSKIMSTGRPITGYVGVLHNPIGHFSFYPAPGSRDVPNAADFKCVKHKTSETALAEGCLFATNAGFFVVETGDCLGNVVFNGTTHQVQTFDSHPPWEKRANFGIDKKGNFVTGYLSTDDVNHLNGGFQELLTGRGWLIRNGTSYVDSSISIEKIDHRFVTIKAPRTGIAYDKEGRLVLLSVDGEEDIDAGADMYEFTELFMDLGVVNAVNLDGGGSGTVFYQGKVVSKPTCDDTPVICERPVTTITCVK